MANIKWNKEIGDGNFFAESETAMDMKNWAAEIKKGRQLSASVQTIESKLKQFYQYKQNDRQIKMLNAGLPAGMYKCVFAGVIGNDYTLYMDVTQRLNSLIQQAMNESKTIAQNGYLNPNLLQNFGRTFPSIQKEMDKLDQIAWAAAEERVRQEHPQAEGEQKEKLIKSLVVYPTYQEKAELAMTLAFQKEPRIAMSATISTLIPQKEPFEISIKKFFKNSEIYHYFFNFLQKGEWGRNIRDYGRWDFKRKSEPFNKPEQYPGQYSPFFYYRGHNGEYKLQNINHKTGLLRYDDTGNMCYGATGKVMLSEISSYYQRNKVLNSIFSKYRVLDIGSDVYALKPNPQDFTKILGAVVQGYFNDFDDPRDKASWIYGLEHF